MPTSAPSILIARNMEKFLGLYEMVTNQFNPFVDKGDNDMFSENPDNKMSTPVVSNPLVDLTIAGIDTHPSTYKRLYWYQENAFAGLGTDAWLSNYAIGIGSTQVPDGVRLAAGAVQFTESDLKAIRNINSSGVVTATTFVGSLTGTATTATNRIKYIIERKIFYLN